MMLNNQINSFVIDKRSYALIWEIEGIPSGHNRINEIEFGEKAIMHLHMWNLQNRKKGFGGELLRRSLPYFFDKFELKVLFSEPYVLNPAPNKILQKVGFEYVKTYSTIPGSLNFEQEVNQWGLTKETFEKIYN